MDDPTEQSRVPRDDRMSFSFSARASLCLGLILNPIFAYAAPQDRTLATMPIEVKL
jgi:hypothetical protein